MTGRQFAEALRSGRRVYGTLIVSTSPRWPEAVRKTGLDFVFIDTEHIPMDRDRLSWMCRTYSAIGLPPLVRIPSPDPFDACKVLDGGACGIVAPYVETPEQVRRLVGATKLRPLKGRRLEQALEDPSTLGAHLQTYLNAFNAGTVLAVNIESTPAVEDLDAILSVPGLDAVLIGPHDLSVSLGIPERYNDPVFDRTVRDIISRARARAIAAGIHYWTDTAHELAWIRAGANLVVHSADITLATRALTADLAAMRLALGETPVADDDARGTTV